MRFSLKEITPAVVILLISSIFFSKPSWGNPGFRIQGTYVLESSQYPSALKKCNPSAIYIIFDVTGAGISAAKAFFHSDTIINLKGFIDSTKGGLKAYRLIFESKNIIDSVWQVDTKYRITDKAFSIGEGLLRIFAYDSTSKIIDQFVYNYVQKFKENDKATPTLRSLLRQSEVYSISDRNRYAAGAAWVLSVGIDKYDGNAIPNFAACQSDAISYNTFFKDQYSKFMGGNSSLIYYNEYLLFGEAATKEAILTALKNIAARAASNDYFIFNFSGFSSLISFDSVNYATYFFPFDKKGYSNDFLKNSVKHISEINEQLISLKVLQEYIQLIQAKNQLFISEAGPSEKFRSEFIRTLMQNSPLVASLLNKNRVIIVPNKIGMEGTCGGQKKGYINYFVTSLDSSKNIYNIFNEGNSANEIAYEIKKKESVCARFSYEYFDIFFERKFLQQYREIFGDGENQTRGFKVKEKEIQETVNSLTGKHYALVVGTNNYNGKGWSKLSNPVKDARAVADELSNSYGFEVQLLEDKPMDSIYKAIMGYYRIAKPNDQLVIYFAGHGDVDDELLDDGFIVCSDSRSVEDDPVRNTYIPYNKLQKMLNNIPARQVLVLLDVCHGGTFDQKAFNKEKREGEYNNITNRNVLQFLKDKLPLRTRKFLSSVGSEPAFDGKAGRNSPFATQLLQVLQAKGSGSNGIVTLSDINAVLQTLSMSETATLKISPHMADFGNVDAFSEFIFIPVEKK